MAVKLNYCIVVFADTITCKVKKCYGIGHLAKGSARDADVLALTDDPSCYNAVNRQQLLIN